MSIEEYKIGTYTFKKENGKYSYRLCLSQWGIFFDFNVDILPKNQYIENIKKHVIKKNCFMRRFIAKRSKETQWIAYIGKSMEVIPGLWFSIEDKQIANDFKYLEKGLKFIAEQIIEISPYKNNTLLVFRNFSISICDYQPEGLTDAVLKWAHFELGVEMLETEVKFNKEINKYEFNYSKQK